MLFIRKIYPRNTGRLQSIPKLSHSLDINQFELIWTILQRFITDNKTYCNCNANYFCKNSKVLVCEKHTSTYLLNEEDHKEDLLSFDSPLKAEYSKEISEQIEEYVNRIDELIKTTLNSLSVFHTNIDTIQINAINRLITLKNTYSNQIKKIYEKTLTMKEANDIFDTELIIDIENFNKNLDCLKKTFRRLFNNPKNKKKLVSINRKLKTSNCECEVLNADKCEVPHCKSINPSPKNLANNEGKRYSSQMTTERKRYNSNKNSKIAKGQDNHIIINSTTYNSLVRNEHEKSFVPYKKPDFPIKLLDKILEPIICSNCNYIISENEQSCLMCRFQIKNSLKKNNETERINEPIPKKKHERLRSNSSNSYLDEEHEEFKKKINDKFSAWRCYLCFKISDAEYNHCLYCYKDKENCIRKIADSRKPWICSCRYENILNNCVYCGKNRLDIEKFDEKIEPNIVVRKCLICSNKLSIAKCSNCNKDTKISDFCSHCSKPLGDIKICYSCKNNDMKRKLLRSKSHNRKIGFESFNIRCRRFNK